MKKFSPLILLLLISTISLFAQQKIYVRAYRYPQPNFTFDADTSSPYFYLDTTQSNNSWQIGIPVKTVFSSAISMPKALVTDTLNTYPGGNISSFELDIQTDDLTYITFHHQFDTDSSKDGGMIEISTDNGQSWENIINYPGLTLTNFYSENDTVESLGQPGFSGSSGGIDTSIIQGYAMIARLRFTFASDTIDNARDGWMIDNLKFDVIGTSVEERLNDLDIDIYPNPATTSVNIINTGLATIEGITLFDINGEVVSRVLGNTSISQAIDVSHLSGGTYFIKLQIGSESLFSKVMVVR